MLNSDASTCQHSRLKNMFYGADKHLDLLGGAHGLRSKTRSAATRRWDYVVIGAGAAGCVIAGRLSQATPDARIALIEAGGKRLGLTTQVPGTAFIASTFPRRNWNFQTEPVPALNGRRLGWFQGSILGGSSSINGMLYLRGHSLEYEQWAQLGCHGWSFDRVLAYFKKSETAAPASGTAMPGR